MQYKYNAIQIQYNTNQSINQSINYNQTNSLKKIMKNHEKIMKKSRKIMKNHKKITNRKCKKVGSMAMILQTQTVSKSFPVEKKIMDIKL
jgi:hypothetical protein